MCTGSKFDAPDGTGGAGGLGLSTVPRTWRIYYARITGPVPVPSKQLGYQLYGRFCTIYVRPGVAANTIGFSPSMLTLAGWMHYHSFQP